MPRTSAPTLVALVSLVTSAATGTPLHAQDTRDTHDARRADTVSRRALAPGVAYRHVVDPRGPWDVHVVRVDLRRADLAVRAARARDSLRGRERVSELARRATTGGT